jgi:hypothetical protein
LLTDRAGVVARRTKQANAATIAGEEQSAYRTSLAEFSLRTLKQFDKV